MRRLLSYAGDIVYLMELGLIALTAWLLRILVVNRLPATVKIGATVLDSRWITLPVSFVLIVTIAWFLHRRLHIWLSKQEWWVTQEDG